MSRKIKYGVDFKLQVDLQIIKKEEQVDSLGTKFNITNSPIKRRVHFYRHHGIAGVLPSKSQWNIVITKRHHRSR